jgi:FkbM family methyltransferase
MKQIIERMLKRLFNIEMLKTASYKKLIQGFEQELQESERKFRESDRKLQESLDSIQNDYIKKADYHKIEGSIASSWEVFFSKYSPSQIEKKIQALTLNMDLISKLSVKKHIERLSELPRDKLRNYVLVDFKNFCINNATSWERDFLEKLYSQHIIRRSQLVERYKLSENIFFPSDLVLNGGLDILNRKLFNKISNGGTVLDCGAFRGETAVVYYDVLKPAKIVAFEPIPDNYNILTKTAQYGELSKVIIPMNCGVFNKNGVLYFTNELDSSTAVHGKRKENNNNDMLSIQVRTIDSVVKQLGLSDIRFIKLDVEDSELEALEGAKKSITRDKPVLFTSIYHSAKEFFNARELIDSWNLQYKHCIRHMDPTNMFTEVFLISTPE